MDTLYSIIYDWFYTYVFTSEVPETSWTSGSLSMTMREWLNHTATIVVLVMMCVFLFMVVLWLFKLIGSAVFRIGR